MEEYKLVPNTTFEDACMHGAMWIKESNKKSEMIYLAAHIVRKLGYIPRPEIAIVINKSFLKEASHD